MTYTIKQFNNGKYSISIEQSKFSKLFEVTASEVCGSAGLYREYYSNTFRTFGSAKAAYNRQLKNIGV